MESPSLHRWGRRILFYDMFASLGPYERFKALTVVVMYVLWCGNMRLHNTYATAPPDAPEPAPGSIASNLAVRMMPSPEIVIVEGKKEY